MKFINKSCFLISTSKNTIDVLQNTIDHNLPLLNSTGIKTYVGCNGMKSLSLNCEVIGSEKTSNWVEEIQIQTQILIGLGYERIILLLDDFWIFKMDSDLLLNVLSKTFEANLDYVLLEKERFSLMYGNKIDTQLDLSARKKSLPYYSSLKISIWKSDYFFECLKSCKGSIWSFEHSVLSNHYSVLSSVFEFDHIVEKGQYRKKIKKKLRALGHNLDYNGRKELDENSIIFYLKRLKFFFIGYYFSRINGKN